MTHPTGWMHVDTHTALEDIGNLACELDHLGLPVDRVFGIDMALISIQLMRHDLQRLIAKRKEQTK